MNLIPMILKSKWFYVILLLVALLAGLYFGGKALYDNGYTAGEQHQVTIYQQQQAKAKQDFDVLQKKADDERLALNNQIASLSAKNAQLRKDLANKEKKINEEKTNYAKTTTGSMSCFGPNDDGLRILNKSLPDSN
ncbi:hypothetical protein [Escherichia phage phiWec186]|nr:hypothetical protein [Escherichia phage phiWec181]BDU12682.1 hypothetical protein [Escherichia phage phiWec186]